MTNAQDYLLKVEALLNLIWERIAESPDWAKEQLASVDLMLESARGEVEEQYHKLDLQTSCWLKISYRIQSFMHSLHIQSSAVNSESFIAAAATETQNYGAQPSASFKPSSLLWILGLVKVFTIILVNTPIASAFSWSR